MLNETLIHLKLATNWSNNWNHLSLTCICTLIATIATAADGGTFLAMIMFISGCFSPVLLGLLIEISANIAKLDNNSR